MRCGIAQFDQRALKPPKLENFCLKVCPLGPRGVPQLGHQGRRYRTSTGAAGTSRGDAIGPRGVPHLGPRGAAPWDLEG